MGVVVLATLLMTAAHLLTSHPEPTPPSSGPVYSYAPVLTMWVSRCRERVLALHTNNGCACGTNRASGLGLGLWTGGLRMIIRSVHG